MTWTTKKTAVYRYRGLIERANKRGSYEWREGYSRDGVSGPEYPWITKQEAQHEARREGLQAVFKHEAAILEKSGQLP